jgi:hypothetical protein
LEVGSLILNDQTAQLAQQVRNLEEERCLLMTQRDELRDKAADQYERGRLTGVMETQEALRNVCRPLLTLLGEKTP